MTITTIIWTKCKYIRLVQSLSEHLFFCLFVPHSNIQTIGIRQSKTSIQAFLMSLCISRRKKTNLSSFLHVSEPIYRIFGWCCSVQSIEHFHLVHTL